MRITENKIENAKLAAQNNGGNCLSSQCNHCKDQLIWKCENPQHAPWHATYASIINNKTWCPECRRTLRAMKCLDKNGLDKAKAYATAKGGLCLSDSYLGNRAKMLWSCDNTAHSSWQATYKDTCIKGHWCPECSREKKLKNDALEIAHNYAASKGGTCLTTSYKNNKEPMLWKCNDQSHPTWKAHFNSVVTNGRWCKECGKRNHSENKVRLIFEKHFGCKFPSSKPSWNKNPWTDSLLELDGYCKDFNIAFEFDGPHHSQITSYGTCKALKRDLIYQRFKDEQKQKNCLAQGILLVRIPIMPKRMRGKLQPFLQWTTAIAATYGITISFSEQQLKDLEIDFHKI